MLSLFPQILFLAPIGVTLLRVVAAFYFAYIGYSVFDRREVIEATNLPIIGRPGSWLVWFSMTIVSLIALTLFVGFATQIAAIAGAIVALKYVLFARTYPQIIALPRSTSLLLFAICLSLIVMGAGAWAIDWPL